jgi:hypothetical protein
MASLVGADDPPRQGGARWKLSKRIRPLSPYSAQRLLLVAAGLAKKQLVWKRAKPVPARRRRQSP